MQTVTESPDAFASITIAAPALTLYGMVTDVARMGEWSPEATGASSVPEHLEVGSVFQGHNSRGPVRWTTTCTVRTAEPGVEFSFDVDSGPFPLSRWSYTFEETAAGTIVSERWWDRRDGVQGLAIKLGGQMLIPGSRAEHNAGTMRTTLAQLKRAAEAA